MQAASSPYLPPYYQGLYHIQPLGSHQDHELKRQYLALLSPQQIIEICLTFDVHVSPYVKSTIWPQDLNAAIAGLRKSTNDDARGATGDESSPSSRKDGNDSTRQEPVMASLDRPQEGSGGRVEVNGERTEERSTEKQLEESVSGPSTTTTTATASAGGLTQTSATSTSSAAAPTSTSATPAPTSSTPAPPPVSQQQQPPYPHQPYGYPQHAAAAYPHAPYYPPPPGYPGYPAPSYPHYPQPLPNGYPTAPGGYPNPYSAPTPSHSQSPSLHYPALQPHSHQDQTPDDLPSYEEMIVEALQESGSTDPEGCAPKDLFSWMAARYPLQSNFRPSASQALQKAFKRGRLEKSSSGKYRLNVAWEGGSTSRRTTRRPQSQSNAPPPSSASSSHLQPPPSGSPFTHAPLVHHHHHHANSQPQHNSGYPYAYGYPGYPQHPAQQQQLQQPTSLTDTKSTIGDKTTAVTTAAMLDDSDRDAYEAAQNILKAINFGDLLQIAQNEDGSDNDNKKLTSSLSGGGDGGGGEVSMDQLTSLLIQAQHAISSQQQSMEGQQQQQQAVMGMGPNSTLASVTPLPTLSATAGVAVASTSTLTSAHVAGSSSSIGVNVRAELQAQLALLAVQLAELGQDSENGPVNGTVAQLLQGQNGIVAAPRSEDVERREQQVDGGLMAVLNSEGPSLPPPPPMNGLLPLSLSPDVNSNSGSLSSVSGSVLASKTMTSSGSQNALETTQSRPSLGRSGDGNDDIPIDPVLRDACTVPVVDSEILPPVSEKITGSGPTGLATATTTSVPSVDLGQRLGDVIPSVMIGEGGGDSDDGDDDMEEII